MGLINVIIRDPLNSCNLSQHLESPGIMVTSEGGGDPTVRDELSLCQPICDVWDVSANGEREQERDIQPQPDPEIDRKVETLVGGVRPTEHWQWFVF